MGFYKNKGHFFDVDDFSLQHKEDEEEQEGSDSGRAKYGTANSTTKEKGTDGKLNNSSEYNHDYYMANKEKWKEGDSDFDESNYNENNLIPGTDLYSFQRKDGSRVVLFEDNKWVLPKGSKLDDATTKRLQKVFSGKKLTDKDADKITAALNEGKSKKASSEKKEEKSSKKSGGSSKKSSGGSSKKSSGGKGKKSSGSKKKSSDGSSKKSSSSGSKKKSSSSSKKSSSSAKTEEEKKAEEEKKVQEQQKMQQEAEAYQKQLAEQQAQKEAQLKAQKEEQQKQQEEQNATGSEYTEEELKKASKKTTKKKKTTTQNAQYAKHFDEHGAIIRYFGGRY